MGFTKDAKIGEGTYGVIYSGNIVYSDGRQERGALKKIRRTNNVSGVEVLREIQILHMCSTKCKYIPRILGVFFEDYTRKSIDIKKIKDVSTTFVTELMDGSGTNVFGIMNYNMNTMIDISSQILLGIAYMHSKIITHRDIKPANILINFDRLSNKPTVKICDFGFSQYLVHSAPSTPETNTPYFRAPEICWQNPKYGVSSDVWAIGVTIYEMLTGQLFINTEDYSDHALFTAILEKNPNQWTRAVHENYLRNSNVAIKINDSLEPCTLPAGPNLMGIFVNSRYYKIEDHSKWLEFDSLLKRMFDYNYNNRISCYDILQLPLFNPFREQIDEVMVEINKKRIIEIVEIEVPLEINVRKSQYFKNFTTRVPRYQLRQIFHAVDLANKIFSHPDFTKETENVEKICAACLYFFHKFFSILVHPEDISCFFGSFGNIKVDEEAKEKYYKMDEWIYKFELKVIRTLFPGFKFFRPGIYEMPDEYGQILSNDQFRVFLFDFLDINQWNGKTYRGMYRELYHKNIDRNFIFR